MDDIKDKIADMVKDMCFERKRPVTKQQKAAYTVLAARLAEIIADLNRLRLRLWHADEKRDYHSLSLYEAEDILKKARQDLDCLLNENGPTGTHAGRTP
jgi:hypothetical protein